MSQAVQTSRVTGDLYAEVQSFYARQMWLVDGFDIEGFAATFTPDGVIVHATRGETTAGHQAMIAGMRASLPRYKGIAVRHWFDKLLIEPVDEDTVNVAYYTLVSKTDVDGNVTFEPTFTVQDVLVRRDGVLYTQSRVIKRDIPQIPE